MTPTEPYEDTRDEVEYPEWTEHDHYADQAERDDDAQQ